MAGFGNFGRETQKRIAEAFKKREYGRWGMLSAYSSRYAITNHGVGELRDKSPDAAEEFERLRDNRNISYMVVSYETPIAWVRKDDGNITIVTTRFSQTTTGHQRMCRLYLASNDEG